MTEAVATEHAEPALRLRGVGRRFGGLHAVRDVSIEVAPGERRAILGPNGAGKTTLFNLVCGDFPVTSGSVELLGRDVTALPARTRAKMGLARTYQQSRLFGGLSVEDNIYLSIVGVRGGRIRPVITHRDAEMRDTPARRRRASRSTTSFRTSSGTSPTASSARSRSPSRWPPTRSMMMLDEPCSGLSRGERQLLTDLLLALGGDLTLIVIEHDMDVALRVAEQVTMMHDGRVIVEGTPDEIRANELVHDLYLGRGFRNE